MHFQEVTIFCFLALVTIKAIGAPTVTNTTVSTSNAFISLSRKCSVMAAETMDSSSLVNFVACAPTPIVSAMITSKYAPTKTIITSQPTATNTLPISPSKTIIDIVTLHTTVRAAPIPACAGPTVWATPSKMTDLSAFNITYFPRGRRHIAIVDMIPSCAVKPSTNASQEFSPPSPPSNSSILQVAFPAWSANPAGQPSGGVDFYASPLDLTGAHNVTLAYCVFFPANFKWVKGGKLPGLYGGHVGCSGGSSALACFSTRLMWRANGAGELYMYAPKHKQSSALCSDPLSRCDSTYGLSIGRGSFHFTRGAWTCLQQTVVLNDPGKQNGHFALLVNGRLAINRTDILYRDAPRKLPSGISGRSVVPQSGANYTIGENSTGRFQAPATTTSTISRRPSTSAPIPFVVSEDVTLDTNERQQGAGFIGLFFSTFFGGHGLKYATPMEQYVQFQDFVITRNS